MSSPLNIDFPALIKDHVTRYLATNGEDGYLWDAKVGGGEGRAPTLLLTTSGRRRTDQGGRVQRAGSHGERR